MEKQYVNPRNGICECLYRENEEIKDENVSGIVLTNGLANGIGVIKLK